MNVHTDGVRPAGTSRAHPAVPLLRAVTRVMLALSTLATLATSATAQADTASRAAATDPPPAAARAPAPPDRRFFRQPTVFLQPGGVTANAVSATGGGPAVSGFNARVTVAVPTAVSWLTPFAGFQFQPNGLGGNHQNQPSAALGLALTLVTPRQTGGWLSASVAPEGIYSPKRAAAKTPYAVDLYGEAAFTLHVGRMLPPTAGQWLGMGAFLLVIQQVTHVPREASGARDYWAPVLVYGLSLPIAPWH